MQMAAVMALKLSAKAPNGASTSVARPVIVMSRDTGMSYPVARITATPGRFCEAMVTTNSGSARLTSGAERELRRGEDRHGQLESSRRVQAIWPRSAAV